MKGSEKAVGNGNLKPFAKGCSGNPAGMPKGTRHRETLIKEWLDTEVDITNPLTKERFKGPLEHEIILALLTKARKGDLKAIELAFDFVYGKQTQKTESKIDLETKTAYTLPDGTVMML